MSAWHVQLILIVKRRAIVIDTAPRILICACC